MKDFQRLLDATIPFVEGLLNHYGEFYPLAAAINKQDEIVQVGTYTGDEYPKSNKVLGDLNEGLQYAARNGDYTCIAIFYDVKIMNNETGKPTDAIAVFAENDINDSAFIFYYPYSKDQDNVLTFAESFGNKIEKEIFV